MLMIIVLPVTFLRQTVNRCLVNASLLEQIVELCRNLIVVWCALNNFGYYATPGHISDSMQQIMAPQHYYYLLPEQQNWKGFDVLSLDDCKILSFVIPVAGQNQSDQLSTQHVKHCWLQCDFTAD